MQSSAVSSKSSEISHRHPSPPSHLYNRAGIFYFRLVLTEKLRLRLGRVEIRLSLRTAYRRQALDLSQRICAYFYEMVENEPMIDLDDPFRMIDYKVIRRCLNAYLQKQLEMEHNRICFYPPIKEPLFMLENCPSELENSPDCSDADRYRRCAEWFQSMVNDRAALKRWVPAVLEELGKNGVLRNLPITSANSLQIVKTFFESQVTYYRLLEKRQRGDYITEEPIVSADFGKLLKPPKPPKPLTLEEEFAEMVHYAEKEALRAAAKSNQQKAELNSQPKMKPSMLYSEAMQVFVADRINEGSWMPHMVAEHEGQLKTFLEIMGNMALDKINREIVRRYRDTISKLPPNYSKLSEYKGKTVDEILELAPEKVLSVKRVNTLVQSLSSMLEWFVREEILTGNPAQKLQRKDERQEVELRDPFEKKDLEKIFAHPKFALGKFKFADYFWVPLVALFSGMRLEEICQLHCKDVHEKDGVWVIDINADGLDENGYGKTLKNKNAKRLVAVHKTLKELGFLRYHAYISSTKSVRLFPNLNKSSKVGKYGKQVGKQFNDLVKVALNVPGFSPDGKTFHSIRHNFSDFYKQRDLQTDAFRQLFGHEISELAARQYGSKFSSQKLYEVVSVLDYELDFSMLKESKYIKELIENDRSLDS